MFLYIHIFAPSPTVEHRRCPSRRRHRSHAVQLHAPSRRRAGLLAQTDGRPSHLRSESLVCLFFFECLFECLFERLLVGLFVCSFACVLTVLEATARNWRLETIAAWLFPSCACAC